MKRTLSKIEIVYARKFMPRHKRLVEHCKDRVGLLNMKLEIKPGLRKISRRP